MKKKCANCRRKIFRLRDKGDWYHQATASTSCQPGTGSWKRATPQEVV